MSAASSAAVARAELAEKAAAEAAMIRQRAAEALAERRAERDRQAAITKRCREGLRRSAARRRGN